MSATVVVLLVLAVLIYLWARARQKEVFKRLQASQAIPVGNDVWTAKMGWRYVAYTEGENGLSLAIEPMVKGNDLVFVPDEQSWLKEAPSWARERRAEILERLVSVAWNRNSTWLEGKYTFSPLGPDLNDAMPNSLEATPGGQALENMRMFEPGSKVTHRQAHKMWHEAARAVAERATGQVTVHTSEIISNSVFQAIVLPIFKKNPRVTIVYK